MTNSGDAAEQIVHMNLNGVEVGHPQWPAVCFSIQLKSTTFFADNLNSMI